MWKLAETDSISLESSGSLATTLWIFYDSLVEPLIMLVSPNSLNLNPFYDIFVKTFVHSVW
jgi:hypothetical protein